MRRAVGCLVAALVAVLLPLVGGAPAVADALNATNSTPITFSGNTSGGGSSYPSSIQVSNHNGPITDVDVTIKGITVKDLGELRVMLVSPGNEAEILASNLCIGHAATNVDLTFDQAAPTSPGQDGECGTGTYHPHDACGPFCTQFDGFPFPHDPDLDHFNGENANGEWRLFVYRECGGFPCGTESIGGGWSLSIDTGPYKFDVPAGTATSGPADLYPLVYTIPSEIEGTIGELEVELDAVFHTFPDDLDIMLEKVGGPRVMLMSDACGTVDLVGHDFVWKDDAAGEMLDETDTAPCPSGSYRPTDHDPGDSLPAPAPPAPYATSMAAFEGIDIAGEWRLWVTDDSGGDAGFIASNIEFGAVLKPVLPETTITKAPRARTHKSRAKIAFVSDPPGGSFECKVDRAKWKACTSPLTLTKLKPGKHKVKVRAVDAAGNVEPKPAVARWRVIR